MANTTEQSLMKARVDQTPATSEAQSSELPLPPDVPDALKVPDGNELMLVADGEGVQVYVCQPGTDGAQFSWTLERPDALLFGKHRRVVAHHYEGPTWEALDGSTVIGQRVAPEVTPDPSAIPWLLLKAKSTSGDGLFSKVTFIQRLHTKQGLAPQTACDGTTAGGHSRSPYKATYYFYRAAECGGSGKPQS